jgi:hypothetical protein
MTLDTHEFIRRFLMHVLSKGLHRIRHYGLLADGHRAGNIAKVRALLAVAPSTKEPEDSKTAPADHACALPRPRPCCGARLRRSSMRDWRPKRDYRPVIAPNSRLATHHRHHREIRARL